MRKRTYLANGVSPWSNGIIKESKKKNEGICFLCKIFLEKHEEKSEDSFYICEYTCPQCKIFLEEYEEGIFRCPICGQVAIEDRTGRIFYMSM